MFEVTSSWWDAKWQALTKRRDELVQAARVAEGDAARLQSVLGELEPVLCAMRLDLIPLILIMQGLLAPQQLAEL